MTNRGLPRKRRRRALPPADDLAAGLGVPFHDVAEAIRRRGDDPRFDALDLRADGEVVRRVVERQTGELFGEHLLKFVVEPRSFGPVSGAPGLLQQFVRAAVAESGDVEPPRAKLA